MKSTTVLTFAAIVAAAICVWVQISHAAEPNAFQSSEYATIRWAGRENTHIIRPNGQVEMLAPLFSGIKRPDRVDERSYLMNIALNAVTKEGFELATATSDEMILRRPARR